MALGCLTIWVICLLAALHRLRTHRQRIDARMQIAMQSCDCGYERKTLAPATVCPECGASYDAESRVKKAKAEARWRLYTAQVVIGLPASLTGSIIMFIFLNWFWAVNGINLRLSRIGPFNHWIDLPLMLFMIILPQVLIVLVLFSSSKTSTR